MRIAIDTPTRTDFYRVRVISPSGKIAKLKKNYSYSAELLIEKPRPGVWAIVVRGLEVTRSNFRMRAWLGRENFKVGNEVPLPDLRSIPPFAPNFSKPDDGSGSDFDNHSNRDSDESCSEDEVAEEGALRCLRFSAGLENAGHGSLLLSFDTTDPEMRMYQTVVGSNGAVSEREAGHFEYHTTHNHFHYQDIWAFELLRVLDTSKGELELVGEGRKSGFCPNDQKIAQWRAFFQEQMFAATGDCGMQYVETPDGYMGVPNTGQSSMGLSAGWGDVYGWYRPGNYVEFGSNGDGLYLIRSTIDPNNDVLEGNESNNQGYALICIRGGRPTVIERGRGHSPWDHTRVVIRDWWKPRPPADISCP